MSALKFCATWIKNRSGKFLRAVGRVVLFIGRKIAQLSRIVLRVANFFGNTAQRIYHAVKPYVEKLVSAISTVLEHVWSAAKKVVQFVDHYVTLVLTKVVLAAVQAVKFAGRIVKKIALFVDKVVTSVLTKTIELTFKTVKWLVIRLAKAIKVIAVKVWTIGKKIITTAWKVTARIASFLKDLLEEMLNTLVVWALNIRSFFLKTAHVVGKILTFLGRQFKLWIWRPFVAIVKFVDRVVTAVLEWLVQTAWKTVKYVAQKLFRLLATINHYGFIVLKHLYKFTALVVTHAARIFAKVASFVKKMLFKLGDKLFDLTLDLIGYTARFLRFTALHIIKPTAVWLWSAIKTVAKSVGRLASSLVELVKSVVLTIYHVTSFLGGRVGRLIGRIARGLARLLVKFHGLVVMTVGVASKLLLELVFRVLYCIDVVVTTVGGLVSYPVKWLLTLAAFLTDYGLAGFWHMLVFTGKLANYLILVPAEKLLWVTGELLTLTLNLLREVMVVAGTLLANSVEWLHNNFIATVKLVLRFAWASVKWLASAGIKMAHRFVAILKISATFLLKVKRKIGAFLIAIKDAMVRMKNRIVAVSVAAWRRIALTWNYLGSRLKAAYNKSGIPRLLAAIKTASIILATTSKQRFILVKTRVGAIITQMRENGKLRRARMWAMMKERTAKIATVVALISGQMSLRARAAVARVGVAMAFMKQRGIAMKNRALVLKNGAQAKIALLTLRMQQRFVQVNQLIVYIQARMAALKRGSNAQQNPPNNNAVAQPVQ